MERSPIHASIIRLFLFAFHLEHAPDNVFRKALKTFEYTHSTRLRNMKKKTIQEREEERGKEKKRGREVTIPISTATFLQYYLWKRYWNTSANAKCDAIRKKCRFFNKILIEPFLRRITSSNYTTNLLP